MAVVLFFSRLFIFNRLFSIGKAWTRERQISHLKVHFQNAYDNQTCIMPKAGAGNSIQFYAWVAETKLLALSPAAAQRVNQMEAVLEA